MAFTEFYCNAATGSNLNAGSTEAAAVYTSANGNWDATTGVFTPAAGDPSQTVSVGMFASVFLDAATVAVFVGRVTAVDATTITVSTTIKSGTAPTTNATGRTIKVGGPWKGPNAAEAFPFGFITDACVNAASNKVRVNFKNNATYSVTAAITHNVASVGMVFQGYSSTPGDGGRAIIDGGATGAGFTILALGNTAVSYGAIADLIFQNNGDSGTGNGLSLGASAANGVVLRCVARNLRSSGFNIAGPAMTVECEAYGCNQSNTANNGGFIVAEEGALVRCIAHDNIGSNSSGFVVSATTAEPVIFTECVADANEADGLKTTTTCQLFISRCVFHGNGGAGASPSNNATTSAYIENCIFSSNTGVGVAAASNPNQVRLRNNAFFSNAGDTTNVNASLVSGSVTLTANPFVDEANGDFSLNNLPGGGALCRGTGIGTFTQAGYAESTTGYPDIGAAQHQERVPRGIVVNGRPV